MAFWVDFLAELERHTERMRSLLPVDAPAPRCEVCGRPWRRVVEYPVGYVVGCDCEEA